MLLFSILLLILSSAVASVTKHEIRKRCTCPEVQCNCVPTVATNYMSCRCTKSPDCSCSAQEQIQQCQPICQEVCQSGCKVNCAICSTECFNSCSMLSVDEHNEGIPLISGAATSNPIIAISPQYHGTVPTIPQLPLLSDVCECSAPVCQCVPIVGKTHQSCNCHYSSPCSCSSQQQLQQCHPVCQEVCQRTCTSDCALCSKICDTSCSATSTSLQPSLAATTTISTASPSPTTATVSLSVSPFASPSQAATVQCTCQMPTCSCIPSSNSVLLSCTCEYSSACSCTPEQQLQQCRPTCQDVCKRSCTTNCATCDYACFTTCSSLSAGSAQSVDNEPLKTPLLDATLASKSTILQNSGMQVVPWVLSVTASSDQISQRSVGSQCACSPPICSCVPTIGTNYLSCNCERTSPCSCTTQEQLEQCQPICQEVCQRSCTINCAVCSNSCFTTCSSSGVQTPQIPQIPQIQPSVPTIQQSPNVPTISQIQSTTTGCACPAPKCYCVPTVGTMYQTCDCAYSAPCSCSAEAQLQQCQPTCQEVCQRTCTVNCAVCSYSCFNTCSALPNSQNLK